MVQNKQQFLQTVNAWLSQATQDVAARLNEWMQHSRMTIEQIADALAVEPAEIEHILRGIGNISLEMFAKLLIATDHVIEIKPLAAMGGRMPHGGSIPPMGGRMPHGGSIPPMGSTPCGGPMPRRPMNRPGTPRPMPPVGAPYAGQPGYPMPPMGAPVPPAEPAEGHQFDSLDRPTLINLVRTNHWDGEIDLVNATRGDIIEFLEEKFGVNEPQRPIAPQHPVAPQPAAAPTQDARQARLMELLGKALTDHPELMDTVEKYLGQA